MYVFYQEFDIQYDCVLLLALLSVLKIVLVIIAEASKLGVVISSKLGGGLLICDDPESFDWDNFQYMDALF